MPMTYEIDHDRKLVIARGSGIITMTEILDYHRQAWSRPDVIGYGEIVDVTGIDERSAISSVEIVNMAKTAAVDDTVIGPAKLAIIVAGDLFFGLGRMYQAYRESAVNSRKRVSVFRTVNDAMTWIGV